MEIFWLFPGTEVSQYLSAFSGRLWFLHTSFGPRSFPPVNGFLGIVVGSYLDGQFSLPSRFSCRRCAGRCQPRCFLSIGAADQTIVVRRWRWVLSCEGSLFLENFARLGKEGRPCSLDFLKESLVSFIQIGGQYFKSPGRPYV